MPIIVFALHGCPLSYLGPYGNEWVATPNFDRLAAEGIVFDQHYATGPDPNTTRRDWWQALPTELRAKAPRWLVQASRAHFDAPQEYYAPFTEVFTARPNEDGQAPFAALHELLPSLLERLKDQPEWLLWIETDRLLPTWHAPQEIFDIYCEDLFVETEEEAEPIPAWREPPLGHFDNTDDASNELLHRSFATAITALDADLGRLFEEFEKHKLDQSATWAIVSDFGYPLGEHGWVGPDRPWLHEEFVHVPFLIRYPNGKNAGTRISRFTQAADLVPLLLGQDVPERRHVVSYLELNGEVEAALRTSTHALLLPLKVDDDTKRPPQLYEKPDDRWEQNNVYVANLGLAEELEAELRQHLPPRSDHTPRE
jgi:arylsulfatase A-like enzyme